MVWNQEEKEWQWEGLLREGDIWTRIQIMGQKDCANILADSILGREHMCFHSGYV